MGSLLAAAAVFLVLYVLVEVGMRMPSRCPRCGKRGLVIQSMEQLAAEAERRDADPIWTMLRSSIAREVALCRHCGAYAER